MDDPRPTVHAMIAWPLPNGAYIVSQRAVVTLEDAADFARFGWEVWTDPWDMEAVTRWDQIQRSRVFSWRRK